MKKLKLKKGHYVKEVIWKTKGVTRTYSIEFDKTGKFVTSKELTALFNAMQESIHNAVLKYKIATFPKLAIDELVQCANMVTMNLLINWKPEKSKWGTYWCNYLRNKMINYIYRNKSNGNMTIHHRLSSAQYNDEDAWKEDYEAETEQILDEEDLKKEIE